MLEVFYVFQNFNNFILIIYLIISCARKHQKVCPVRHVGSSIQGSVTEGDKSTATAKVLRKSTKSMKSERTKKTKNTETVKSDPAPNSTVPEPTQSSTASSLAPLSTQMQTLAVPTPKPSCGVIGVSSRPSCNKLPTTTSKTGEAASRAAKTSCGVVPTSSRRSYNKLPSPNPKSGEMGSRAAYPMSKAQSKAGSVNKTLALEPKKKSSLNQTV